jgi:hypothetical protein
MTQPVHSSDTAQNRNEAVTGQDRRTLDAIFRHPLAHNLSWREVVALIAGIGEAEERRSGEFQFHAGDQSLAMKRPHGKELTGPDVIDLRHFLIRAGWSPNAAAPSESGPDAAPLDLIVVIDHAGAKVYRIDPSADDKQAITAYDPRHLLHHFERKARDADRNETDPNDERFFEQVAAATAAGGAIVVIGHGKAQSNEADHLSAYLKAHHPQTYARIVREIVADLPHLTTPELLTLGRHALG